MGNSPARRATVSQYLLVAVLIAMVCLGGVALDGSGWSKAVSMWSVITH